jgi:hypothetical protein
MLVNFPTGPFFFTMINDDWRMDMDAAVPAGGYRLGPGMRPVGAPADPLERAVGDDAFESVVALLRMDGSVHRRARPVAIAVAEQHGLVRRIGESVNVKRGDDPLKDEPRPLYGVTPQGIEYLVAQKK